MSDLTFRVFDNLEITSHMDVDQQVAYMQRIFRGAALKNYRAVLVEFKQSVKDLAGNKWDLG